MFIVFLVLDGNFQGYIELMLEICLRSYKFEYVDTLLEVLVLCFSATNTLWCMLESLFGLWTGVLEFIKIRTITQNARYVIYIPFLFVLIAARFDSANMSIATKILDHESHSNSNISFLICQAWFCPIDSTYTLRMFSTSSPFWFFSYILMLATWKYCFLLR